VVAEVMRKVQLLRGNVIPEGVEVTVTRDYGRTATNKSDELLFAWRAVVGVSLLIALVLGGAAQAWSRWYPGDAIVDAATFFLLGFTLNR
jgi:hypothetical protein